MYTRNFSQFAIGGVILTFLVLLLFGVLRWLNVPAGDVLDWLIGIASFWWLLVIVTVPWDIYFQARAVLDDAATSQERKIEVSPDQVTFVRSWVQRALLLAIALHLLSAAGLYALAASGISPIGYIASGAALLLIVLRPVVRAYEYLSSRLAAIQHQLRYPREDVVQLRYDLEQAIERIKLLEAQLDLTIPTSWAMQQHNALDKAQREIDRLHVSLKELSRNNEAEHTRLARESEHAIAQITADGQFLDHVREIIRFFKQA